MKFCYVDMIQGTDVDAVFDEYKSLSRNWSRSSRR